jgi:hypothetical protein
MAKKRKSKDTPDTEVRDGKGKLLTVGTRDLCMRWVKHRCPDGDYNITGPGIDLVLHRQDGTVYPTAGTIDGMRLQPLTDQQAKDILPN